MSDQTSGLDAGFSLADLADIDVSAIEEVRFTALAAGVYDFEVTKADLAEDEKDGLRRFKAEFELKVVECLSIMEPNIEKESMVGKLQTERFFIIPSKTEDEVKASIGRVRAFITDIGQDSAGTLGVIVRNAKGHTFRAKIRNAPNKDDPSRPYRRLELDTKK